MDEFVNITGSILRIISSTPTEGDTRKATLDAVISSRELLEAYLSSNQYWQDTSKDIRPISANTRFSRERNPWVTELGRLAASNFGCCYAEEPYCSGLVTVKFYGHNPDVIICFIIFYYLLSQMALEYSELHISPGGVVSVTNSERVQAIGSSSDLVSGFIEDLKKLFDEHRSELLRTPDDVFSYAKSKNKQPSSE